MNWIKIEPGCEMPEIREKVILVWHGSIASGYRSDRGTWDDGDFHDNMKGVTHWARVELPNN